jgi:hypothetical protein
MSTFRDRKKKEKPKPRAVFFSFVYFVVVAVAAYFLAGLAMGQVDLDDLLNFKVPVVDLHGRDIPEWVLRLVLAVPTFFVLQMILTIVTGLLGVGKKEDEPPRPYQWRR